MNDILTRDQLIKSLNRAISDARPNFSKLEVMQCDADLREVIRQALEHVKKLPHAESCASRKQCCLTCGQDYGDHYGENCASSHDLDKWKPSPAAKACNCGHDAAIDGLRNGLGK